ncbi:MAG: hypothetical protein ACFFD1_03880, partial [Candidatus Thorarchaeota archaeon]
GEMRSIVSKDFTYNIKTFGLFRVVIVSDSSKKPATILTTIGYRFIQMFRDVLEDDIVDMGVFQPFKPVLKEILEQYSFSDVTRQIKPSKRLTTKEIFHLPNELHSTALAFIQLVSATMSEISQETKTNLELTGTNITKLKELGYLGEKKIDGETKFFCSIE